MVVDEVVGRSDVVDEEVDEVVCTIDVVEEEVGTVVGPIDVVLDTGGVGNGVGVGKIVDVGNGVIMGAGISALTKLAIRDGPSVLRTILIHTTKSPTEHFLIIGLTPLSRLISLVK